MSTNIVLDGYELVGEAYLAEREKQRSDKYVRKLLKRLKPNTKILDLGCGAGVPVDDLLLAEGHEVVGIDISPRMIARARRNCPAGQYMVKDILRLNPGDFKVEAIVSFYTWFHLPRSRQGELLKTINSYVGKGGYLLITMGDREFEGEHQFFGMKMWSSQWGIDKNSALVERAGWKILEAGIDTSGGERHQIILAQKK